MTQEIPFNPDWTMAPGASLANWMHEKDTGVTDLAARCVASDPRYGQAQAERVIREVLDGGPLTPAHADLISRGTVIPASFWLNYERQYRDGLAAGRTDTTGEISIPGDPGDQEGTS